MSIRGISGAKISGRRRGRRRRKSGIRIGISRSKMKGKISGNVRSFTSFTRFISIINFIPKIPRIMGILKSIMRIILMNPNFIIFNIPSFISASIPRVDMSSLGSGLSNMGILGKCVVRIAGILCGI